MTVKDMISKVNLKEEQAQDIVIDNMLKIHIHKKDKCNLVDIFYMIDGKEDGDSIYSFQVSELGINEIKDVKISIEHDKYLEEKRVLFEILQKELDTKGQMYVVGDNISPKAIKLVDKLFDMSHEEYYKELGELSITNLESFRTYNFLDGVRCAIRAINGGLDIKDVTKEFLSNNIRADYDENKAELVEDISWRTHLGTYAYHDEHELT